LYYDSHWVEIGGTASGARMQVSDTAPSSPLDGSLWFNSTTAETFIYYDSQWIEVGDIASSAQIADAAITEAKLANSSVTSAKLSNGSVTTAKIEDSSVTEAKLAANSVTTAKILDGAVTSAKLANGVIPQTLGTSATVQFQNLTLTGNLTVQGTTTTVNANTLSVNDSTITLNANTTGAPTLNGSLKVERGTSSDVFLRWNETKDVWEATADGTQYFRLHNEEANVKDFGATGDGTTDDTSAFSSAATYNSGAVTFDDNGIARAAGVFVTVPEGTYNIASLVDTGGREVIWVLDRTAKIINAQNLNGKLYRPGQRISGVPFGTDDNAVGMAVRLYPENYDHNIGAEVLSVLDEADLAVYTDRDAVAMFADILGPAPTLTLTNATYTSTTVVPATAISATNLKKLRVGMIIDTAHSPTKYSGFVTGWASNGTSITVQGWYLANGTGQGAVTPTGSVTAYVNPFTKIWAHNANVLLDGSSHATAATGFELGIVDNKSASSAAVGGSHYTWGFDAVNLGSGKVQAFFIARGAGFSGLRVDNADNGLYYRGTGNIIYSERGNETAANIRSDGTMELGRQDTAATWYMDIHTSGNDESVNDYDARIQVTGGSTTDGSANVTFFASNTDTQTLRPRADNSYTLGGSARRWTQLFAVTATINTSDEREKDLILEIDEPLMQAWGEVQYVKFKFKDAITKKGDGARWHFGLIAQRVKEVFENHGLDPFAYGILCYDEWSTEDGIESGDRYGIRYEEALALECAYLRYKLAQLQN